MRGCPLGLLTGPRDFAFPSLIEVRQPTDQPFHLLLGGADLLGQRSELAIEPWGLLPKGLWADGFRNFCGRLACGGRLFRAGFRLDRSSLGLGRRGPSPDGFGLFGQLRKSFDGHVELRGFLRRRSRHRRNGWVLRARWSCLRRQVERGSAHFWTSVG